MKYFYSFFLALSFNSIFNFFDWSGPVRVLVPSYRLPHHWSSTVLQTYVRGRCDHSSNSRYFRRQRGIGNSSLWSVTKLTAGDVRYTELADRRRAKVWLSAAILSSKTVGRSEKTSWWIQAYCRLTTSDKNSRLFHRFSISDSQEADES